MMNELGTVTIMGSATNLDLRVNAFAYESGPENRLMVVSAAGPDGTIKACRSLLLSDVKLVFATTKLTNFSPFVRVVRNKDVKYEVASSKLQFHQGHLVARAKYPGLCVSMSEAAVWEFLNSEDITTPVRRKWVPYIKEKMIEERLIEPLRSFGCSACLIEAGSSDIDGIVTDGVKSGKLDFED